MLPISREEDNLKLNLVTLINTFSNCSSVYDGRCKTDRRMSTGKIGIPSDHRRYGMGIAADPLFCEGLLCC